jgi:hypothetical protein
VTFSLVKYNRLGVTFSLVIDIVYFINFTKISKKISHNVLAVYDVLPALGTAKRCPGLAKCAGVSRGKDAAGRLT